MTQETNFNISELVNHSGCFDLQFRKDTRHERTGSPTYYRWKLQFIITAPASEIKNLERASKELGCGNITAPKNTRAGQARFSVQNIDDIGNIISPYFKKNALSGQKKKDFDVWQKAVAIIWKNKGKKISVWEKNDLLSLVEIHKLSSQYKGNTKSAKWIEVAKIITKKESA